MLRTADLDYDLPIERIATTPAEPRDSARLMVVRRADPGLIEHARVSDLPRFLSRGDLIVLNQTRVIPARFTGVRADSHGKVEGLYLGSLAAPPRRWTALIKARRQSPGVVVSLHDASGVKSGVSLRLVERSTDEAGAWIVEVLGPPADQPDEAILDRLGLTPLPPYILHARRTAGLDVPDPADRERYQTVFAREGSPGGPAIGSVAAPTAGLHLTPALLDSLARQGVARAGVMLTVGSGTFKPVETEFVEQHPIHAEWCGMSPAAVGAILRTRQTDERTEKRESRVDPSGSRLSTLASPGRVICVGTTACRTVESYAALNAVGSPPPPALETRLLITPGYRWLWTDGMLTNFHLPRSTLMAMVAAMVGGVARLKDLYALAICEGYRFYSYGDAMLILP